MIAFQKIYDRAVTNKGSEETITELLADVGPVKSAAALKATDDDRYLSMMTKCVFRAGFVWKVIDNKWDGFEAAFHQFDPGRVAFLEDDQLEELRHDTRIIRNPQKIRATRDNALFIVDVRKECGSFGVYLADWPADDTVGLWDDLHKRGSRLGGMSAGMFLREMGKDTFMFSPDVVKTLIGAGVIEKAPTSKKAKQAAQQAFNTWGAESGRSMAEMSRICAFSQG